MKRNPQRNPDLKVTGKTFNKTIDPIDDVLR